MHRQNRSMIAVILLLPVVIALALWAFTWPSARLAPRDLPVGVAGPANATAQLEKQFAARDGAFEVTAYEDESAARTAIQERDIYGAVVATPDGPKVLTASAASPTVAQLLTAAVQEQAGPDAGRVAVDDVVAAPAADPRGAALNSSVLPLALAGVAAGALVTLTGLRGRRAIAALLGGTALVGLVAAGLAHSWLGIVDGNWWAEAGAFALTALAGGAGVAGFAALLGTRGIGVGALFVVLLGNPFSGVTSAPELLPEPAGLIGQWLPPGAGGTLLRSVAFFDGNAIAAPLVTLGVWVAVGLTMVGLGAARAKRRPGAMSSVTSGGQNKQQDTEEVRSSSALADAT
ncbi:ABC transporter permease [Streptomyces sp. NPDC051940]|uniref:ABC transporter permease n=1 Tax=Streptomyces sp. NPDC051940 TaxID=3155675 RepID=UPI00342C5419